MRDKLGPQIDDLKIGKLMEEFGFKPDASHSTARALILNLVRSAYGPEAAREFMRQMNLEKNRDVEASVVMEQFKKERQEIPGVGTAETQLSLFDAPQAPADPTHPGDDIPSTFALKKSRRA